MEAFPQGNNIPTYGQLCGYNVGIHANAFTERKLVFRTNEENLFSERFDWEKVTFISPFDGRPVPGKHFILHIKNNMREQLLNPDIVNRNLIFIFKTYMERLRSHNLLRVVGDAI